MSNNVRIFFAYCVAALLLGRAAVGCGDSSTSSSVSSSGDETSSSASSSSSSTSSSSTSSSSGAPCDHCNKVETMGGGTANLCPGSKAAYDALELCKCGMLCMKDCPAACNGAGLDPICTACLDTACHNDLAACSSDQ